MFEEEHPDTQTAILDLKLEGLTGEACVNVSYMAHGPTSFQMLIEIESDDGNTTNVLNVTASEDLEDHVSHSPVQ